MPKSLYTMVGMQFRGTEDMVRAMEPGTSLGLIREPDNPHDPNAVAVYRGQMHLAYVKGTEARGLAKSMDAAGQTQIEGVYKVTGERWPQVEVDSR